MTTEKTLSVCGMTIDIRKLSTGIYELFDEHDRAVMAFGMVPQKFVDILERQLADKFNRRAVDLFEELFGHPPSNPEELPDAQKRSVFVSTISRAVTTDLYAVAEMVV